MKELRAIDLFCGAGGSSWGARLAGAEIVAGFDASDYAGRAFQKNFPEAQFYGGKLERIAARRIVAELGHIDLLLASPECTYHSVANGGKGPTTRNAETAFNVTRFARAFEPRWIIIENVIRMRRWSRYSEFVRNLKALGYWVSEQTLNAADVGVPQSRRRLFLLCDLHQPPPKSPPRRKAHLPAARILDSNGHYPFSPLRTPRRAATTLQRARRAIDALGRRESFLLVYYGSDHNYASPEKGGWQPLDVPLRTITTLDRFAYVKPSGRQHVMRMLQVPELKAAMGMPQRFLVGDGPRRDRIRLIGNAVCPPVMRFLVRALVSQSKRDADA